jgi:autotransporter-associated beta strand protein
MTERRTEWRTRRASRIELEQLEKREVPAAPVVLSISRANAAGALTNASSVDFTVAYDQNVTGVDASDFHVVRPGGILGQPTIAVAGSGPTYTVTVSGVAADGPLQLGQIDNDSIIGVADGLPLNGVGTNPTFANAVTYAAGASVADVAFADFNGDFKPDLIVANPTTSRVSILLGNGDGTFRPALTTAADQARYLHLADVNGDGKIDVLTIGDNRTMMLLLGNGDGTLRPGSVMSTDAAEPAAFVRMNDDAIVDLVFSTTTPTRNLQYMPGNGDGTFQSPRGFIADSSPASVRGFFTGADLSGDGKTDIVFSGYGTAYEIVLGNGGGTFGFPRARGVPVSNAGILADLNGDGNLDIVAAAGASPDADGLVNIAIGNGNAVFQALVSFATGPRPDVVIAADVNGDGFVDLATHSSGSAAVSLSVLLGNGDRTFRPALSFPSKSTTSQGLASADINGDGLPDFAIADNPIGVTVLLNNSLAFLSETYQVDQTAPTVTLTSTPPSLSNSAAATFAFNAVDAAVNGFASGVARTEYRLDGGAFMAAPSPLNFTNLVEGQHSLEVRAVDNAGNVGTAATYSWTIDFSKPFAAITAQPPPVSKSSSATFVFSSSVPPVGLDHQEYRLDGGAFITATSPLTLTSLGDGIHTFEVRGVGGTGSAGPVASYSWNIDLTGPLISIFSQPAAVVASSSATFVFSAADPITGGFSSGLAAVDYRIDGGAFQPSTGRAQFESLLPGSHTFTIRGADNIGNTSVASVTWMVTPRIAPLVTSINRALPAGPQTNATSVSFTVSFSETVTGVDAADFRSAGTGNIPTALPISVSGSGAVYTVTIGSITGTGSLGLNLVDDNSIRDADGMTLAPQSFPLTAQSTIGVGSFPENLAAADLNGDGAIDLLIGNSGDKNVGILLNNGDGIFKPQLTNASQLFNAERIAATDVNSDGKVDLLISYFNSITFVVYPGNGDGTFQAPLFLPIANVRAFTTADLNGDGKVDLLVARDFTSPGQVAVYLGNGDATFKPQTTYAVTGSPRHIGVGDINGDGKPDVNVATNNYRCDVLLGNGDGTLQPQINSSTSGASVAAEFGDLNADGKVDFIGVRAGDLSPNLALLFGNGDGTFSTQSLSTGNQRPTDVTVSDIDRDGVLDLVAILDIVNTAAVYLGNGNGTFKPSVSLPVGAGPRAVLVTDINGDQRPDLAVANAGSNTLSLYLGQKGDFIGATFAIDMSGPIATITSQPAAATKDTTAAFTLTAVDPTINGVTSSVHHLEYQLDSGAFSTATSPVNLTNLAEGSHAFAVRAVDNVGNVGVPTVYTWLVDLTAPTVTIGPAPAITFATASFTFAATDPLGAGVASGVHHLEYQLDGGSFGTASNPLPLSNLTSGNHTIGVRAVDNAGNVGPVTNFSWLADFFPAKVQSITRLSPNYALTNATSVTYQVTFNKPVTGVDAGDFALALAGVTATPPVVVTALSSTVYNVTVNGVAGSGTLALNLADNGSIRDVPGSPLAPDVAAAFQTQQTFAAGAAPQAPTLADVNGDGKRDLIVANSAGGSVSVFLGNGDGTFKPQQTFAASGTPASVATGDFNGDGKVDLAFGGSSAGVLLGNGDGSFQAQSTFAAGTAPTALAVGDVNGDGKADIAVVNKVDAALSVLLGNGDGTFSPRQTFATGVQPSALAFGDLNGDGAPDLVIANSGGGGIGVLLGNGSGVFQQQMTFAAGANPATLALGDLDLDGKLDVAVANAGANSVSVLLGSGNGALKPQQTFATSAAPQGIAIALLNGDRKPDLAVAAGNRVGVFLGNADGTFAPQTSFAAAAALVEIAVGDVNGDTRADLATTDAAGAGLFLNAVKGDFAGPAFTINRIEPLATLSANTINENVVAGALIGTLAANDPNAGGTFTFSLPAGLTDNAAFSVSGTSLRTAATFDFETKSTYNVTVRVTHLSGLSYDKVFLIGVQNIVEQTTVYVDDDWVSLASGAVIPDADLSTAGAQPAIIGSNAFAALAPAIAAADAGGTANVIIAPGAYDANVTLDRPVGLVVAGAVSIGGVISGGGPLRKFGAGALTLTGANTYAGNTTIEAGTLQIGNGGAAGSILGSVLDKGTLSFNRADSVTFDGLISGTGSVVKAGNGALALSAGNTFSGGLIVSRGEVLASGDNQLGAPAGSVTVQSGRLTIVANFTSGRQFVLTGAALQVNAGVTLTLVNARVNGGSLFGPGVIATGIGPAFSTKFTGVTSQMSLSINANGADTFSLFTNNGSLTLSNQAPTSFDGFNNTGVGRVTANGITQVSDFSTVGQLTVNGLIDNVGGIVFGGASTINPGGTIDVKANDALVAFGSVTNNGSFGSSTKTIFVDSGGIVKGAGTFGSVITQNGGVFAPGNGPGAAATNQLNLGNSGALEFEIANATGAPGAPSGWDMISVRPTVFNATAVAQITATFSNRFTIRLVSRLDSGDHLSAGPAANFDPTQAYAWKLADMTNAATSISGTFNPADFRIDTSGFANPFTNTFSVELRDGGKNLYIVYGPPLPATTLTLSATPNATTGGELVTLTAVAAPNPGSLGTITFRDGSAPLATVSVVGGMATLQTSVLAAGAHALSAFYSGAAGFAPSLSNTVGFSVTPSAPQLVRVTLNDNNALLAGDQRSRVASLVVVFNQPVQLDAGALALALHTSNVVYDGVAQPGGYGVLPGSLNLSTIDGVTWIVTFSGNTDDGADGVHSLKDGVYDFKISATSVHPVGVPTLNMSASSTTTFHRLYGDVDKPETPAGGTAGVDFAANVNTGDNFAFRSAFNRPSPDYRAFLDFDGSGLINTGDNLEFRNRFNKSLTWKV